MKKLTLASAVLLACALVTGCSSSDEEEVELTDIVNQFEAKIEWQEQVGDGVEHYFSRLSPTVYKDTVFAASRDGTVKAFELATGKEKWEADLSYPSGWLPWADENPVKLSGGLAQGYGKVFVGNEHGELYALDRETGALVWKIQLPGEVITAPAVGEGFVVVNTGAGKLIALHPDSGEQRWVFEQEVPPLTLRGVSEPVINGGGVIIGEETGGVSVVLLEQGFQAWQQPVNRAQGASDFERLIDVDTKPVIYGGNIYVLGYNGSLAALEMRSGRVVWKREYAGYRNIAIKDDMVYLTDSRDYVYAVEASNGIERWSQSALRTRYLTDVAVVGDYVITGDREGLLHWFKRDSGELVSRTELDSSGFYVSPLVTDDNKVIVITRDGELSVLSI